MRLEKKRLLRTFQVSAILALIAPPSFAGGFYGEVIKSAQNLSTNAKSSPTSSAVGAWTSDSSFLLNGTVPSSTALMHIQVAFHGPGSALEIYSAPVTEGRLYKRIYLRKGPGNYSISVWYSKNSDPYQPTNEYVYYGKFEVTNSDTRDMSGLLPSERVQSDAPEIVSLAQEITQGLSGDADKALAIHDWVASHIAYDAESYFSGSYKHKPADALRALHDHRAFCEGFSNLFAALARASGLRAKIVTGLIIWPGQKWEDKGAPEEHAWNEVWVNGRWIALDSTWDSGNMDFTAHQFIPAPNRKYYDSAPETFALDHHKISELQN